MAVWVRFGVQLDYSCRLKSASSTGEKCVVGVARGGILVNLDPTYLETVDGKLLQNPPSSDPYYRAVIFINFFHILKKMWTQINFTLLHQGFPEKHKKSNRHYAK